MEKKTYRTCMILFKLHPDVGSHIKPDHFFKAEALVQATQRESQRNNTQHTPGQRKTDDNKKGTALQCDTCLRNNIFWLRSGSWVAEGVGVARGAGDLMLGCSRLKLREAGVLPCGRPVHVAEEKRHTHTHTASDASIKPQ